MPQTRRNGTDTACSMQRIINHFTLMQYCQNVVRMNDCHAIRAIYLLNSVLSALSTYMPMPFNVERQ